MSKVPTIPERIAIMKSALNITEDVEFGRLGGMSKSVVNQLLSGQIKSFAPRFAYKLEENTRFSARWIMLGEGPEKLADVEYKPNSIPGKLYQAAEKLPEEQQYMLLKISNSLAEPEGNGGDKPHTPPTAATQ